MARNILESLHQKRPPLHRGTNVRRSYLDNSEASSQSESDPNAGESSGPLSSDAMSFILKEDFPGLDKYEGAWVSFAHLSY